MRRFSAEVNISSSVREFLSLAQGGCCRVQGRGMASLFYVIKGVAYFSIDDGEAVEVSEGALYGTTGDMDIVISAQATVDGLHMQDALESVGYCSGGEWSDLADRAAVFFHAAIPSIANPLPGVLPPFIALSREDIEDAAGFREILDLFQNDHLLRGNIRDYTYKRIAEIIATSINEYALERLENNMTLVDTRAQSLRMTRVLNAIHQHPEYKWTLVSLAEKANLSRSAFAKAFKSLTGVAPLHYLARIRMERAACELRSGQKPISQIAIEAGYESDASFNKAFCKIMGDTPGHYRRSMASG